MKVGQLIQRLVLSAAIASSVPQRAFALHPEMRQFAYISEAVNKISYLRSISRSPSEHIDEIARTACDMLTRVGNDEQFHTVIRRGFGTAVTPQEKQILLQLGRINNTVDNERRALDNLGIDNLASVQALAAAIPLAFYIDGKSADPKKFFKDITILQNASCDTEARIEDAEVTERREKAIVYGLTGLAIAIADAATGFYSLGLAVALTAISGQIGSKMTSDAAHDLFSSL